MARRSPATEQEYREALKLLEAGHKQTGPDSVAELLDRPDGTVGRWATQWKMSGVLRPDSTVDWDAFELWVQKKVTPSQRSEDLRHQEKSGEFNIIPRKITGNTLFDQDLAEIVQWWRERKRMSEIIRESYPKKRRTYFIYDDVHQAIERQAKDEGVTVTEIVNRALRVYLEGHTRPLDER